MSNVQRIHLGPDSTPLQTGRSSHGRWRYAFQVAPKTPEDTLPVHAALFVIQDADRMAFALTDGPAASFLGDRLADFLWTRETASDDWPQNVRDWLADMDQWKSAPSGLTSFICGRLERNVAGGRLYLAWLGMNGIALLDRLGIATTLDTVLSADEGWSPERGPEPVGMALHAYRGSLFGLERMVIYTQAADPMGLELPDMSSADLAQAIIDWSEDCERDLAFFDLRLNPVLTQPSTVIVAYRWTSPDLCVLSWQPTAHATGYRVEQSTSPIFESPTLLAELTDGRQVQYSFSPPPNGLHYFRVVPLNQGAAGNPSDPISVVPMTLASPVLDPIRWSDEGGYYLSWSVVPQATSYEIQTSPGSGFSEEETHIIYRGEAVETYLPHDTPLGYFYRVRAINVLYAPHTPSHWSSPQRAAIRLEVPVFTQVTPTRVAWTSVPGARQYAVHVTAKGQDEQTGETLYVIEPHITPADSPAVYRVQAQRSPDEMRTASEWSDSITLAPAPPAAARRSVLPFALPVLIGAIIVALLVGGALGIAGMESVQSRRATGTQTPLSRDDIQATHNAATLNATQATAVIVYGGTKDALQATIQYQNDIQATRTRIPTITPSRTPNMTATMGIAFANAQTATSALWTETPTPTNTPNLTSTVSAAFANAQTATAALWTETPTPTDTPNMTETVNAVVAGAQTATAAQWTATPTSTDIPTNTATYTPTNTATRTPAPNVSATVSAAVAGFIAATETARPTLTLGPKPSQTPNWDATVSGAVAATLTAQPTQAASATPDWEATVAAVQTAALPAGCFLTDLPADPLPVLEAPEEDADVVYEAAPRYSIVMAQLAVEETVWIRVLFAVDSEVMIGWVLLPSGLEQADYLHGADCPPPDYVE